MEQKIAWEKHPVSPERKAELRKQGYKIIDARFAPDDRKAEPEQGDEPAADGQPAKRGRKPKAEPEQGDE